MREQGVFDDEQTREVSLYITTSGYGLPNTESYSTDLSVEISADSVRQRIEQTAATQQAMSNSIDCISSDPDSASIIAFDSCFDLVVDFCRNPF